MNLPWSPYGGVPRSTARLSSLRRDSEGVRGEECATGSGPNGTGIIPARVPLPAPGGPRCRPGNDDDHTVDIPPATLRRTARLWSRPNKHALSARGWASTRDTTVPGSRTVRVHAADYSGSNFEDPSSLEDTPHLVWCRNSGELDFAPLPRNMGLPFLPYGVRTNPPPIVLPGVAQLRRETFRTFAAAIARTANLAHFAVPWMVSIQRGGRARSVQTPP